jgi:hypothetical protein
MQANDSRRIKLARVRFSMKALSVDRAVGIPSAARAPRFLLLAFFKVRYSLIDASHPVGELGDRAFELLDSGFKLGELFGGDRFDDPIYRLAPTSKGSHGSRAYPP